MVMEHLMGCHGEWALFATLGANFATLWVFVKAGFGIVDSLPEEVPHADED